MDGFDSETIRSYVLQLYSAKKDINYVADKFGLTYKEVESIVKMNTKKGDIMINLGDIVTNKVNSDIEFGVVIDTRKRKDSFGFINYEFRVRFKLKNENKFKDGWWSNNVIELHKAINAKNICYHCPMAKKYGWEHGDPLCQPNCQLQPDEDAEEVADEDYPIEENKDSVPYIEKKYTLSNLEEYRKCQELALRVRRVILSKFKKIKSSDVENSSRVIKRNVYVIERNKFDIYGEIDRMYSKTTGELYEERITIHCALKGAGHCMYDQLDTCNTRNINETEYRIDGPRMRMENVQIFNT